MSWSHCQVWMSSPFCMNIIFTIYDFVSVLLHPMFKLQIGALSPFLHLFYCLLYAAMCQGCFWFSSFLLLIWLIAWCCYMPDMSLFSFPLLIFELCWPSLLPSISITVSPLGDLHICIHVSMSLFIKDLCVIFFFSIKQFTLILIWDGTSYMPHILFKNVYYTHVLLFHHSSPPWTLNYDHLSYEVGSLLDIPFIIIQFLCHEIWELYFYTVLSWGQPSWRRYSATQTHVCLYWAAGAWVCQF